MQIDNDTLKVALAKAVLDTMTAEKREEIITNAVASLLNTKSSDRYDAPSVLQHEFNTAVRDLARKIATEELESNEEVKAAVRKLITDAWIKLTGPDNYSNIVGKIADAMAAGLAGRDRF